MHNKLFLLTTSEIHWFYFCFDKLLTYLIEYKLLRLHDFLPNMYITLGPLKNRCGTEVTGDSGAGSLSGRVLEGSR